MEIDQGKKKKSKGLLGGMSKKKKDRWALSEDARRGVKVPDGEYVGAPEGGKKKKKEGKAKRRKKGGDADSDSYVGRPVSTPSLPLVARCISRALLTLAWLSYS
jgi:hypothetical protein